MFSSIKLIPRADIIFRRFDSPAMYTRSIDSLEEYVGVWLNQKTTTYQDDELPFAIVYPTDFLPIENENQMGLIDTFFSDFEAAIGVKTEKISIADTWQASPPNGVGDVSIQNYLKDVSSYPRNKPMNLREKLIDCRD